VEVAIEPPPTLLIPSSLKILLQGCFELLKENKVLRPLTPILALKFWILARPVLAGSTSTRLNRLYIFHITTEPGHRTRLDVEFIRLIEIGRALGEGNVDGRFAGQSPCGDFRVDEVGAPWCGVAGHEKADCRIGHGRTVAPGTATSIQQAVTCFVFMTEVGEYVNDPPLMDLRCIASK
jgi:hypothetical protein